jgi:hypothetical protein
MPFLFIRPETSFRHALINNAVDLASHPGTRDLVIRYINTTDDFHREFFISGVKSKLFSLWATSTPVMIACMAHPLLHSGILKQLVQIGNPSQYSALISKEEDQSHNILILKQLFDHATKSNTGAVSFLSEVCCELCAMLVTTIQGSFLFDLFTFIDDLIFLFFLFVFLFLQNGNTSSLSRANPFQFSARISLEETPLSYGGSHLHNPKFRGFERNAYEQHQRY